MYGNTIYDENRRPKEYEVLPLSELMQKDEVMKRLNLENAKKIYGDKLLGAKVVELHRIAMGELFLPDDLPEGECRELTEEDLQKLQTRNK